MPTPDSIAANVAVTKHIGETMAATAALLACLSDRVAKLDPTSKDELARLRNTVTAAATALTAAMADKAAADFMAGAHPRDVDKRRS